MACWCAMNAELTTLLDDLVVQALDRRSPTRTQALGVLTSDDDDLLSVVAAGGRVRRHFFGNRVKLNLIVNMKSGLCPEDCSYCSQRRGSEADVLKYNWVDPIEAAETADRAGGRRGRATVCLVASGRGPTDRDIGRVAETVRVIKERHPDVEVCTSLGLLTKDGPSVSWTPGCTPTTTISIRARPPTPISAPPTPSPTGSIPSAWRTKRACPRARAPSSAWGARRGHRRPGVRPAQARPRFGAGQFPDSLCGHAAGRPVAADASAVPAHPGAVPVLLPRCRGPHRRWSRLHLRSLQTLGLHLANSIFLGDYLTSEGQAGSADLQMIADAGFVVEGQEEITLPAARRDLVSCPARSRHRDSRQRLTSGQTAGPRAGSLGSTGTTGDHHDVPSCPPQEWPRTPSVH